MFDTTVDTADPGAPSTDNFWNKVQTVGLDLTKTYIQSKYGSTPSGAPPATTGQQVASSGNTMMFIYFGVAAVVITALVLMFRK